MHRVNSSVKKKHFAKMSLVSAAPGHTIIICTTVENFVFSCSFLSCPHSVEGAEEGAFFRGPGGHLLVSCMPSTLLL